MFSVRSIALDSRRVDSATYEMALAGAAGEDACERFAGFLAQRPPEFREKLPFLQRDLELAWSAAPGGVALASFHTSTAPLSLGILLAGVDTEADRMMLAAWRDNVLAQLLPAEADAFAAPPDRPMLLNIVFPTPRELEAPLQLTAAALASVYFRYVQDVHARHSA